MARVPGEALAAGLGGPERLVALVAAFALYAVFAALLVGWLAGHDSRGRAPSLPLDAESGRPAADRDRPEAAGGPGADGADLVPCARCGAANDPLYTYCRNCAAEVRSGA